MPRTKEFDYDEKLAVAHNLFWQKGYNETSLHDLVDAMQLNRSSIYNTYGSKHDLFIKCLHNYTKHKLVEYKQAGARARSPLQAVENIIRSAVENALSKDKICLVVRTSFEMGRTDEQVRQILRVQNQAAVRLLADFLRQAQAAGEVSANKDPEMTAQFIVASFSGLWQSTILSEKSGPMNKLIEYLMLMLKN